MISIRPCMVSFFFSPRYSGSSIQALNLSRQLRRLGAEPFIVSANLTGSPAQEIVDDIPVHRLPVLTSPAAQVPSFMASLGSFLIRRRREFDLIHAHGTLQHGMASLAGGLLNKPTILKIAMADSDLAFARQGRAWGTLNRFMVSRFNAYIATTDTIAQEFQSRGLDTTRVRLIPNGVDTEQFAPLPAEAQSRLRAALQLPAGPIVTYVGIINARKNVDGILRIWREVVARGTSGQLVLLGPVPQSAVGRRFYDDLRGYVSANGLDGRVFFTGHQPNVAQYLQCSDVFLFPSRQEGMPNSVLEAMSCALPCVVSRGSGVDALIAHGESGMAIDVDSEPEFAAALAGLLESPALRARIGRKARETVMDRFSLARTAERYLELYSQMLGQASVAKQAC
jgi:glycosyltransferase involved in cell wall biosynthesis